MKNKNTVTTTKIAPKKNPYEVIKNNLKTDGIIEARKILFEEADKEASRIQLDILQQRLKLTPLSKKYLRWKKKHGKDQRILICDGFYVAAIKARRIAGGTKIEVGLPNTMHPEAKMQFKQLATILELGSEKRGIPPRPHWSVSRARFLKNSYQVKARIQDKVEQIVFSKLKQQTGTKKVTKTKLV